MKILVNTRKHKNKVHIWNDEESDTYCTMYSTGGLGPKEKFTTIGAKKLPKKGVCNMCKEVYRSDY